MSGTSDPALVLVVDDEAGGRQALEGLLLPEGYRIATATSGREALAACAHRLPDVVLLDVMMPGMDGYEVCRRLRAAPATREVPVIMVTALDDRSARLEALDAGADDFVSKPFDRIELRTRLRATVRLNRYRRLLAERERFRWLVDRAEDGMALIEPNGTASYMNAAARAQLGLSPDAPLPAELFMAIVQQHYSCDPVEAWRGWPQEHDRSQPLYLVRPESPTTPPCWLLVDCLAPSGWTDGTVVQLRDVTAAVTRRADMHAFRTLVAHKLRTPLNHLWAGLELVGDDDTLSVAEVRQFATMAFQGAERLRRTIDQILRTLDGAGAAAPQERFALADLAAAAEQAAELLGLPPDAVSVTIAPPLRDRRLTLTPTGVELLLHELFDNARKFAPRRTPRIEVRAGDAAEGVARIAVLDDGVTLSPQQLQRAWAPYYQCDKDGAGEVPGIGLGLAYVAAVVARVGGRRRLRNREPGPGVVVELELPLA